MCPTDDAPRPPAIPGDPEADAALLELMTALHLQAGDPSRRAAVSKAHHALAHFKASGNHIFLWEAIEALTNPFLGDPPIAMPAALLAYLHRAAVAIRKATNQPSRFPDKALAALGFAGKRGASVAKDYRRSSKLPGVLAVYEALMARHGAMKAEEMIGKELNLQVTRVREIMVEARKFTHSLFRGAGVSLNKRARTGSPRFNEMTDDELLALLRSARS